jgi:hypothetical protein
MKQIVLFAILGAASLFAPTDKIYAEWEGLDQALALYNITDTTTPLNYSSLPDIKTAAPVTNISDAQYWFEMGKFDSKMEDIQGMLGDLDRRMLGMSASEYLAKNP